MAESLPFGEEVENLIREFFLHGLTARNRDGYLTPVMHTKAGIVVIALPTDEEVRGAARAWLRESDEPDAYALVMYDGQVTIEGTTTLAIVIEYLSEVEDQREVFAFRYRVKTAERGPKGSLSIEPLGGVIRLAT
jgi:hypothetical protein